MTDLRNTPVALPSQGAPFETRAKRASDVVAREALLDACFGENRHMRPCQRLRDGRAPAEGLALSAVRECRLVGTLRLWHVSAGGIPALVLGPLAVDNACRSQGAGAALMAHALVAGPSRGAPPRRRALLCALRLLGREDRRAAAPWRVRARAALGAGVRDRRAR